MNNLQIKPLKVNASYDEFCKKMQLTGDELKPMRECLYALSQKLGRALTWEEMDKQCARVPLDSGKTKFLDYVQLNEYDEDYKRGGCTFFVKTKNYRGEFEHGGNASLSAEYVVGLYNYGDPSIDFWPVHEPAIPIFLAVLQGIAKHFPETSREIEIYLDHLQNHLQFSIAEPPMPKWTDGQKKVWRWYEEYGKPKGMSLQILSRKLGLSYGYLRRIYPNKRSKKK